MAKLHIFCNIIVIILVLLVLFKQALSLETPICNMRDETYLHPCVCVCVLSHMYVAKSTEPHASCSAVGAVLFVLAFSGLKHFISSC